MKVFNSDWRVIGRKEALVNEFAWRDMPSGTIWKAAFGVSLSPLDVVCLGLR